MLLQWAQICNFSRQTAEFHCPLLEERYCPSTLEENVGWGIWSGCCIHFEDRSPLAQNYSVNFVFIFLTKRFAIWLFFMQCSVTLEGSSESNTIVCTDVKNPKHGPYLQHQVWTYTRQTRLYPWGSPVFVRSDMRVRAKEEKAGNVNRCYYTMKYFLRLKSLAAAPFFSFWNHGNAHRRDISVASVAWYGWS